MDKISGILPSSPRVQAVDLKNSIPVRPGAPQFGRPVGTSTAIQKDELSTAERATFEHQRLLEQRMGDQWKSEIAKNLSDAFFMRKTKTAPEFINDPIASPPTLSPTMAPITSSQIAESAIEMPEMPDDLDSPEVGRYIDVQA